MQQLTSNLWLMEPMAMRRFMAIASAGISVDAEHVRAAAPQQRRQKSIAILPVHGVLEVRPSVFGRMFGMSSYEGIGRVFDAAMADESVSGVILDVASPGGMAYGAPELAEKIFAARGPKPIVAVANPLAASGAYWIASAADRLVVTQSGDVGSVGVLVEHVDVSQAMEAAGEKVTVIRSAGSPHKAESNELEPLSDEARQHLQSRVDAIYQNFSTSLAKYRGVSVDHVNEHFGKGRVVGAKQAMAAGMVDRVATLDEVAYLMASGRLRMSRSAAAQDEWNAPTLRESRLERAERLRLMADSAPEAEHETVAGE